MTPRKIFVALAMACALAALSFGLLACRGSQANTRPGDAVATTPPAPPATVTVSTAPAIQRELPRFFEATGTLAADEQTDVAPQVAGRIVAVGVDLGSYVQRGAVLVRLDDGDARLRLQQAQAQLAQAQASARQAEERIALRAGQPFNPERVAEVAAARAALDLAERQLQRYERLAESGDVSRAAYDQQRAQRDQLREQYNAALAQARQGYAGVQTARAAAAAAAAQVEQAQKAIRDAVVVAPLSGYVAERPVAVGEFVSTQSKVATIVRTNPMRMQIDIPEQAIANVRAGQSVSLSVSAYPQQAFSGRIARISPNITPASRTLTVEAEVENGNGLLRPGQFATVRILLAESQPAILVPARAVRTDASGTARIFVVKDGRVEERLVQTGQAEGELIEIRSGLAANELVATSNLEQLSDRAMVSQ